MKRSIAWHEHCLQNQQDYLRREREFLEQKIASFERLRADVEQYAKHINKAKADGMAEFDSDMFNKKRKQGEKK